MAKNTSKPMRYLAIDYGKKKLGLAVCDKNQTICSPLACITGNNNIFIDKIIEVIKKEDVDAIVLGLPFNMDGSKGFQAGFVTDFAESLKKKINIPIYFQDERLSTFAAEEKIASIDLKRAKKKKLIDSIAAANILESFLEEKRQNHPD